MIELLGIDTDLVQGNDLKKLPLFLSLTPTGSRFDLSSRYVSRCISGEAGLNLHI